MNESGDYLRMRAAELTQKADEADRLGRQDDADRMRRTREYQQRERENDEVTRRVDAMMAKAQTHPSSDLPVSDPSRCYGDSGQASRIYGNMNLCGAVMDGQSMESCGQCIYGASAVETYG